MEEEKSAEELVDEMNNNLNKNLKTHKNFKQYIKNKKFMFAIGLIAIVLIITGVYLRSESCRDSSCSLTGNVIFSDNSKIVADFNGGKITSEELDENYELFFFLRGLPESYKALMPKKSFLNQTISEELLYSVALKNNYKINDKEVESNLKDSLLKSQLTLDDFKNKLNEKGIEYSSVINFYKKQLIITKFFNDTLFKNLKILDKDAEDYYNENKEIFKIPKQIRASHILVNSSEEAEDIVKKLDFGEDFAELAKENSIGPSALKGGDLGFFGKDQMVPEFEEAAFSLKNIGDYTKTPIKTQFGYHVIKLTGKQEAKTLSFEESKEDIKKQLLSEKQNELLKNYLEDLLEKANVKVYEENINEKIREDNKILSSSEPQEIKKTEKPTVELFVMSYCPYGTQAEKGLIPVFELLENKIDSKIRLVHYTMHGKKEDTENFRQICIREEQNKKYLDYLSCFLEDSNADRCLKEAKIDENKLDNCMVNNAENYYKKDSDLSKSYGVQGSPTLVINGEIVSSGRSPLLFLSTICSAFNNPPKECNEKLDSANPNPGFGYLKSNYQKSASCSA